MRASLKKASPSARKPCNLGGAFGVACYMVTKRLVFALFVVASIGALLATANGVAKIAAPARAESAPQFKYHQTLRDHQSVAIDVSGDLGADIHVIGSNAGTVNVSATAKGALADRVEMRRSQEGPVLRFAFGLKPASRSLRTWLHLHSTNVEVVVYVPRSVDLSATAVNGSVVVDKVTGRLAVRIVNGPIEVTGAGTLLSLRCTNGPIDAAITSLTAVLDIDIRTTNGPIDVTVPKGFKASSHTSVVFGAVDNNLPNSGPGHMDLHAVTGAISVEQR